MLKHLMQHVGDAHKSTVKAMKELEALLDYLPLPVWLQVADTTMRLLVFMQVPEVHQRYKNGLTRKKPMEGEGPIN